MTKPTRARLSQRATAGDILSLLLAALFLMSVMRRSRSLSLGSAYSNSSMKAVFGWRDLWRCCRWLWGWGLARWRGASVCGHTVSLSFISIFFSSRHRRASLRSAQSLLAPSSRCTRLCLAAGQGGRGLLPF